MYFDSFAALWQMGVHGPFVWSAFGIGVALILLNVGVAVSRGRRVRRDLKNIIRRQKMMQERQ
ncbi:heme exporter protein CcmD [Alcanivorax sp. JB21]|uniref:heme exporter protein CcmD n=1 Tax=Alcanivorax limicola TaxID=2874102 RepID=UPI001CC16238|nr:heme exporter protein CcmD [Alcanivorax limicola]MBZ2189962.1 heme exporter protein CcmD [Alcanivorax limicola]